MSFEEDTYHSPALHPSPSPTLSYECGKRTSEHRFSVFLDRSSAPTYQRFRASSARPSVPVRIKHDVVNLGELDTTSPPKVTTGSPTVVDGYKLSNSATSLSSYPRPEPAIHAEKNNLQYQNPGYEPPYETRISWLHYGPYYPGAPCVPATLQQRTPSNPEISTNLHVASPQPIIHLEVPAEPRPPCLSGEEFQQSAAQTHHGRSVRKSFLGRISSRLSNYRHSNSWASFEDRHPVFDVPGKINGDDIHSIDLSTLEGGNVEFRRRSIDSGLSATPTVFDNSEQSEKDKQGHNSAELQQKLGMDTIVGEELRDAPKSPGISTSLAPEQHDADIAGVASIRKMGQNIAEKNQAIVAITERTPTIDLSSLGIAKRASLSDPESPSASSHTRLCKQSYFYPEDPEQPNWRPFTMRSFFMVLLVFLAWVLAGVQEYLCQMSLKLEKQSDGLLKFNDTADVSVSAFFCWKYLPTILFVAYGVLWQMTDYDTKRLEPYYQLSQPTGSIASTSLNLDYFSVSIFLVPVKAFRHRHWAVFCASISSLFATTVAPSLQNPSVIFVENPQCEDSCPSGESKYFVRIHPVWSRLLTVSLIIVALFGIVLFIQLRRKTGLLSDPKGIAGVASMATKSHILTDFQGMDESRHDKIHKRLKHHRYILYKSTIWHGEYIKQEEQEDPDTKSKVENPHPLILRLKSGIAFLIFLFFCLVIVPIINFTPVNAVSTTLPWLPVLIATIIKQLWSTLEFAVRAIEPFYVLSKGNARPQATLTLDYRGTPYGILPFLALRNKHYIVALAGLGSILGDILTVTVSSFSINGKELIHPKNHLPTTDKTSILKMSVEDQTFVSFWTSIALSIAVLLFLITSASLIYTRRRHAFLPRQPSTLPSVLAFIHQSRMLDDFVDTEQLNNREMQKRLTKKGKRYGLGWFKGRDGKPHCAVDEEPMLSRYAHGMSYIRATAPWEEGI